MDPTQRPAHRRPLSPPPGDVTLGSVIAEFLAGRSADRELRAALRHVDAELGSLPVRDIRPRHVTALLDDLRRSGLSARRSEAVEDALHALFAFAVARRLVAVNPLTGPPPAAASPPRTPTPTFAMVALGARVAFWTTWVVLIGFLALLLILLVELG